MSLKLTFYLVKMINLKMMKVTNMGRKTGERRGRWPGEKRKLSKDQRDLLRKEIIKITSDTAAPGDTRLKLADIKTLIKKITRVVLSKPTVSKYLKRERLQSKTLARGRPPVQRDKECLNAIKQMLQLTNLSANRLFDLISQDAFFKPLIGNKASFYIWLKKEGVKADGRSHPSRQLIDRCELNLHLTCFNRQPDDNKPTDILAILWAYESATGFLNCQLFRIDEKTNINVAVATADTKSDPPKKFITSDSCTLPLWAISYAWADAVDRLGLPIRNVRLSQKLIAYPDSQVTLSNELTDLFKINKVRVTVEQTNAKLIDNISWPSDAPLDKLRIAIRKQVDAHNLRMADNIKNLRLEMRAVLKKATTTWKTDANQQIREFNKEHPIKLTPLGSIYCRPGMLSESEFIHLKSKFTKSQ